MQIIVSWICVYQHLSDLGTSTGVPESALVHAPPPRPDRAIYAACSRKSIALWSALRGEVMVFVKAAVRKFLRHVLRQFHGLGIVSIARKSSQETSLITRCRVCPGAYPVISS